MNRRKLIFSAILFALLTMTPLLSAAESASPIPEGRHGKGELRIVKGIPVMFLRGTPEEIGEQHGKLVGKHVSKLLAFPKLFLKRSGREKLWPFAVAGAKLMVRQIPADHRKELSAAVKHSGQDGDSIVVANTMLELRRMGGCSSLIVGKERSKTGQVIFGRNFDFPPLDLLDKYNIVSVIRPKGKIPFVSIGYPGLCGVISGMNEAGLCVATLDVYNTNDGSPNFDGSGKPMMFTYRRILEECRTVKEAEAMLRKNKATTWMNLSVCDKNGGVVFELTPKSVVVRKPVENLVSCTNHFRSPELGTAREMQCKRYAELITSRKQEKLGIEEIRKHMHAVNQGKWTIQTMIFEPASMKLHLALRKPPTSNKPLTTLDVRELLKQTPPTASR